MEQKRPSYIGSGVFSLDSQYRGRMPKKLHARFREAHDQDLYIIVPELDPVRLSVISMALCKTVLSREIDLSDKNISFFQPDLKGHFRLLDVYAGFLGIKKGDKLRMNGYASSMEIFHSDRWDDYVGKVEDYQDQKLTDELLRLPL